MGRLDTALNGKDGRLFGHQKLRYEVCGEPQCMEGEIRDPNTGECVVPPCTPEDADYECDCRCGPGEVCKGGICLPEEDPICNPPYVRDPNTGDCVCPGGCGDCDPEAPKCPEGKTWDPVAEKCIGPCDEWPCPDGYEEYWDEETYCWRCKGPKEPCGRCYKIDENTGECVWDSEACDPCDGDETCPNCVDSNGKCTKCPGDRGGTKKPKNEGDQGDSPEPPKTYCDDFRKYGYGATVNQDKKITGAHSESSTQSGIRYYYSTDCYSKVECYFRFTAAGIFPNKAGVEFGHTRIIPSGNNYTEHIVMYDLGKADWRYNDVFKLIIYADGKQETYMKRFIREGVWTEWVLFDCTRYPQTPPANEIKWMMLGVCGPAEIWDITVTLKEGELIVTDPTAEPTVYPQQATATYDKKVYGTVHTMVGDENIIGKTPLFLYNARQDTDGKWKEGDTINGCTYNNGILTIPRYDSSTKAMFKYTGRGELPDPYGREYCQWIFDMKFRFKDYDSGYGMMYIRPGADAQGWQNPMYFWTEEISLYDFVGKECRLQIESYCNQTGEYNSYGKIFVWENNAWTVAYNFSSPVFDVYTGYWGMGFRPYIEIELASWSDPEAIEVHYVMEGAAWGRS